MARIAWELHQYSTLETYELDINPSDGGSPSYNKTLTTSNTTAPGGKVLIFEGADEVQQISVTGTLLTEALYDKFIEWWDKRTILRLTDDLARVYDIYITSFDPQRVRSVTHPWRHTYTLNYVIIEGY
jgi:hypothetical protein